MERPVRDPLAGYHAPNSAVKTPSITTESVAEVVCSGSRGSTRRVQWTVDLGLSVPCTALILCFLEPLSDVKASGRRAPPFGSIQVGTSTPP